MLPPLGPRIVMPSPEEIAERHARYAKEDRAHAIAEACHMAFGFLFVLMPCAWLMGELAALCLFPRF